MPKFTNMMNGFKSACKLLTKDSIELTFNMSQGIGWQVAIK